jgi:excisionase family DNA binding protein
MNEPGTPGGLVLDDWITPREAAELIGVTSDHVRHLARAGIIEAQKFGHAWMLKRAAVEAYTASERRPGPKSQDQPMAD